MAYPRETFTFEKETVERLTKYVENCRERGIEINKSFLANRLFKEFLDKDEVKVEMSVYFTKNRKIADQAEFLFRYLSNDVIRLASLMIMTEAQRKTNEPFWQDEYIIFHKIYNEQVMSALLEIEREPI